MASSWVRAVPVSRRRFAADLLTASRWVVAAAFPLARPSPPVVVALVAWVWLSDTVDGPLARAAAPRAGPGRILTSDHAADAAVGVALLWHLGTVGFVPAFASRVVAVALVAVWLVTRVLAAQMLLQALAYGGLLWWAVVRAVPGRWVLVAIALVVGVAERRRLVGDLVPTFLRGWARLLGGQPRS